MTDEYERLQDLNIEEAVGRNAPPDLTGRILAAADKRELDEAVTPISGRHAVPRTHRPTARRMTGAVARKNWQGAGIVTAFALLFTIGLAAFVLLKDPGETTRQDTAETQHTNEPTGTGQRTNQSPPRERRSPDTNEEQPNQPDSSDEPEPDNEPTPDTEKPDDMVNRPASEPKEPTEEPKPEPKDTVEEPKPEPEPLDEPVKPKPETEPQDTVEEPTDNGKTAAKPETEKVAMASFSAEGRESDAFVFSFTRVRTSSEEKWISANDRDAKGISLDEQRNVYWIYEGTQLKCEHNDIALTNGAQVNIDGEISLHQHPQGMRIELLDNDAYIDNHYASSELYVTRGDCEIRIGEGAALLQAGRSRLKVMCVEGSITANGTDIPAGFYATWTSRGLSRLKEAGKDEWLHGLLTGAPERHLGIEEFDVTPQKGMISGQLEPRTKKELAAEENGNVAVDSGRNASVAFQFDELHKTLWGEKVRIRYRATGARKLILQLFCPARNDNFGIDIEPWREGEWYVLEVKFSDLRDRETHKDAPPPGTQLSSISLILSGEENARLEVDWVELARDARWGE